MSPFTVTTGSSIYPDLKTLQELIRAKTARLVAFDAAALAVEAGNVLAVNMVLLGALIQTDTIPLSAENVKTAISIEKPIFEQMDNLAKNLNVSRSRLFTMAAREFIERHNNIELLKQLNEAYEDSSETEPMVTMMHSNHYRMVKDQW